MSGARVDLGELDAALAALEQVPAVGTRGELGARVLQARAAVLEVAGRTEEAAEILAGIDASLLAAVLGEDDDVVVYDLTDEVDEDGEPVAEPDEPDEPAEPAEPAGSDAGHVPDGAASDDVTVTAQDDETDAAHVEAEPAPAPSDEDER